MTLMLKPQTLELPQTQFSRNKHVKQEFSNSEGQSALEFQKVLSWNSHWDRRGESRQVLRRKMKNKTGSKTKVYVTQGQFVKINSNYVITCKYIQINSLKKGHCRASLVTQWLRICLPMQGTQVRALVWEDPTCRGATGPVSHNY